MLPPPPSLPTPLSLPLLAAVVLAVAAQHKDGALLVAGAQSSEHAAGYGYGYRTCAENFKARTADVNAVCCDDQTEDCSSGRPATCNVGCARVLLPYFADCRGSLGIVAADFEDVIALCHAAQAGTSAAGAPSTVTPPSSVSAPFAGSRIITEEWGRALIGFIGEGAPTRWEQCYSSFTMDARTPGTFHANCDAHSTTILVAHNTGGSFDDGRRTTTNPGHSTFGGYVRTVLAPTKLASRALAGGRPDAGAGHR